MRVVGAKDVEGALGGELRLEAGDVVTPLAQERALELNVRLRLPPAAGGSREPETYGTPAAAIEELRQRRGASSTSPPSGALYRRGGPVVQSRHRPENLSRPAPVSSAAPGAGSGRVTVVGAGHVGVTSAMRLAETDLFDEVVMVDIVPGLAAGLALDLWHSSGLQRFATPVRGTSDQSEAAGSDYVVVTAGRPRRPGMSRTDLTAVNAEIVRSVCHDIARYSPDATVIIVTNPLDEMTALARQETGFGSQRILGMAGVLDSARFCSLAAEATGLRPDEISALALGSHGTEMVVPLSQAHAGPTLLREILEPAALEALVERTRNSGAEVVGLLRTGSAYYAPAAAVARMVEAMARDTREVLPACVLGDGTLGISDTYVGLPARLGARGVIEIVDVGLLPTELDELRLAAQRIAERVTELAGA